MSDERLIVMGDGRVRIEAPAKLNLGLRVFPARADGFHEIETWMVATSWHDTVTFVPTDGALELVIKGRAEGIPTELDKNLVGKAARRLAAAAGIETKGRIELHKVLPPRGGLGGGSSDAASVLVGLNHAWGLHWPAERLREIAAELGSDVPFFVEARAALCTGRGEIMTPLVPQHLLFAVLIIPPEGCPTKDVYQAFDAGHRDSAAEKTDWKKLALAGAKELNGLLVNDLERGAFQVAPWLEELRDRAAASIGDKVHVTGSGSTLFTLTGSSVEADEIAARLTTALPGDHAVVPVRVTG